jgi:hypothetical protein
MTSARHLPNHHIHSAYVDKRLPTNILHLDAINIVAAEYCTTLEKDEMYDVLLSKFTLKIEGGVFKNLLIT